MYQHAPQSIKKPKIRVEEEDEDEDTGDIKVGVSERGERYVELGKKKRATVNTFKGACRACRVQNKTHTSVLSTGGKYLDIREFYGDEDDLKPGKKGISLSEEQVRP